MSIYPIAYNETPAGHIVGLNPEYRVNSDGEPVGLYLYKCGGGVSCLGFDYADRKRAAVVTWLQGAPELDGIPEQGEAGTLAGYDSYMAAMDAGRAYHERTGQRCNADLLPLLTGREGERVVIMDPDGQEVSRFWVGKSTGWMPSHLEIKRSDSHGGAPAFIPEGGSVWPALSR